MKRLIFILAALFLSLEATGQLPDESEFALEVPTYLSPAFFGPNALPVPDMVQRMAAKLELDLDGSYAVGRLAPIPDKTGTLSFALRGPLFSDRVNFAVWGQLMECYSDSPEIRAIRKASWDDPLNDWQFGDIYFSVNTQLLLEKEKCPGVILRAAFKTASGGRSPIGRFFNEPGYFFDISAFKHFRIGTKQSLAIAVSSGFLCWQVESIEQNDAVMYAASLEWSYDDIARISAEFGGYSGWIHNGDKPKVLKAKAYFLTGRRVSPYVEYWHGFTDWYFDSVKAGVRITFGQK